MLLSRVGALAVATLALSLSSACASKVAGLKQDKSFTLESVSAGKMAIGGVTSFSGLEAQQQAKYASMLRTMVQEERPDFEIAPAGAIKGQIGGEQYQALMDNYGSMGSLDADGKGALSNVKAARYVMFCIIEGDDVANTRELTFDKDKKGNKVSGTDKILKRAVRTITANLSIYDVTNGKRVWTGSVTKEGKKETTYEPKSENLLLSLVKLANKEEEKSDDENYPPPDAPTTEQILNQVFRGFGENMPS